MPSIPSRFAVAVLVVLSLVAAVRPAAACRCLPPSLGKAVRSADVVFVGTIERVDAGDHAIATVKVRAVWKGAVAVVATVHDSPTSCRKGLTAGDTLVFMAKRHQGHFTVRQCNGTQRATAKVEARLTRLLGASTTPPPSLPT